MQGPQPRAQPRAASTTPSGTAPRCSTRSWCARSATPTATARVTSPGSSTGSTTCSGSASTACGCRRSTPSPLRDGGYDVADYTAVLPEFGTLADFRSSSTQAHARGIRIVIDLVMNHTSDQHPWFQASRADPEGPYGDFYVWSDTDDKYPDARIIFVDTETSNWTFDPVRRQFFWHRFFCHQPDLNFENPRRARGDVRRRPVLDGHGHRRLPARRGPLPLRGGGHQLREPARRRTSSSRKLRAMVDAEYPGRILLAEANQWPGRGRRLLRHRGGAGVPHVLPLPGDAAHLLLAARGEGGADHRRARRHPGDPDGRRSGAPSCATTTS